MISDDLLLALRWAAFCIVHSCIDPNFGHKLVPDGLKSKYRFYRLFFNTFSAIELIPLCMRIHHGSTDPARAK